MNKIKKPKTLARDIMLPKTKYIFIVCAVFLVQMLYMDYIISESRLTYRKLVNDIRPEDTREQQEEKQNKTLIKAIDLQPSSENYQSVMYFESLVQQDFPTASSGIQHIPNIIHQTYKDENIPVQFEKYIRTIVEKNSNWTYYLWTDESATKLVSERFPQLLTMWHDYKTPINRADAIRYLVLYEFGGFYGDLDVECGRPLDNLTMKYSCIIPPEPFEQGVFRLHVPYLLSNAIMLCRPKHPFMKHMIDSLHQYKFMMEQIDIAGPSFVTSQFIRYNNITANEIYEFKQSNESNSPYFYKGNLPEDDINAVYVPNTQYFINSLRRDWMNERDYNNICANQGTGGTTIVTKACNELKRRLSLKERKKYAFTDHHWYKSYNRQNMLQKTKPIRDIVRKYTIY